MKPDELRIAIQEIIKQELEEISSSGAAGAFMTPNAFTAKGSQGAIVKKKLGWTSDYTDVEPDSDNEDRVDEVRSRYQKFKAQHGKPQQKIAKTISQINRHLSEIEHLLSMNARLKADSSLGSDDLWKRTHKHFSQMESKVLGIARRIKELKS